MSEFAYKIVTKSQESTGTIEAESKSEAKRKLTSMFKKSEITELTLGEPNA